MYTVLLLQGQGASKARINWLHVVTVSTFLEQHATRRTGNTRQIQRNLAQKLFLNPSPADTFHPVHYKTTTIWFLNEAVCSSAKKIASSV